MAKQCKLVVGFVSRLLQEIGNKAYREGEKVEEKEDEEWINNLYGMVQNW